MFGVLGSLRSIADESTLIGSNSQKKKSEWMVMNKEERRSKEKNSLKSDRIREANYDLL